MRPASSARADAMVRAPPTGLLMPSLLGSTAASLPMSLHRARCGRTETDCHWEALVAVCSAIRAAVDTTSA